MNTWIVKRSGLYWIVRRHGESSWRAPTFEDRADAVRYAENCAKSSPPATIEVYSTLGELERTLEIPVP